jgi:cytochrome c-type biogenesis protein CcmH/NrfF
MTRPLRPSALAGAVALLAVLATPIPARATDTAAGAKGDPGRAITSQLICPCSCGEILSGCTCETAVALKAYVDRELKAGKDRKAIEASLVAKYGEVILGAPKAKGFNVVVWIAPFVATLIGFGIASMVLVRWVRRRRDLAVPASGPAPGAASPGLDASMDQLRARAEAELRELKG